MLMLFHIALEALDTLGQGAQERGFLLADDLANQLLLRLDFGEVVLHLLHKDRQEVAHKRLIKTKESEAVAHGATQHAADDITRPVVRRQLSVGDGEAHGAAVVGEDAHGHVGLHGLAIFNARHLRNLLNQWLEYVGVVVGGLALQHAHEALEAHARIDVLGGQFHQVAVGHAVVLHEHKVPDFNHLRVVLVHQVAACNLLAGNVVAQVDVDFGAGTARAGFAHFPEVVLLVAVDDSVLADMLFPVAKRLHVSGLAVLLVAAKNGHIKPVLVDFDDLGEVFPSVGDGLFLEVVAEAPVAEHLEHGVVVGVVANFLQIIVFARDAEAFLRVGGAVPLGGLVAQKDVLELVHAGVGEHQGRVVLDDDGCRGHDFMPFGAEEVQKAISDFVCVHFQWIRLFYFKKCFKKPCKVTQNL